MTTLTTVPDIDPETVFDEVSTVADLTHALAVCGGRHVRKLSFPELMREQADLKRRLREEFGPGGEQELQQFSDAYPALCNRAEAANMLTSPAFAVAAVRVLRNTKERE